MTSELTPEDVEEILRIFAGSDMQQLDIEFGATRLQASKSPSPGPTEVSSTVSGRRRTRAATAPASAGSPSADVPAAPAGAPAAAGPSPATVAAEGLAEVRSPLLGIVYRRPSPDQPPFVELGSEVGPDDPVCIVDVMKMFTRIPAGTAGRIVEICVQDAELVEHGQVLMRIEPR